MNDPQKILEDILKLKSHLDAQDLRLPPGLAGMYGEILAFKKMRKIFKKPFSVIYFSGQKGADVQITRGQKPLNIEIKTSRLKDEGFGEWYGAALNVKKCRKGHCKIHMHPTRGKIEGDFCYFDFLVFVALSNNLRSARYYVIPREFAEKNMRLLRNTHKRFSSSTHRILVSDGRRMPRMSKRQHDLIKRTEKYKNRWDLIRRAA